MNTSLATLSLPSLSSLIEDLYASTNSAIAWQQFLAQILRHAGCEHAFLIVDSCITPPAAQPATASATILWADPNRPCLYLPAQTHYASLPGAIGFALASPDPLAATAANELLTVLKPHLQRVAQPRPQQNAAAAPHQNPSGSFPDLFDTPVISLDLTGAILSSTPAARSVLTLGGLQSTGATLTTTDPADSCKLRQMIHGALTISRSTTAVPFVEGARQLQFAGAALFHRQELPALGAVFAAVARHPNSQPNSPAVHIFLCDISRSVSSRAPLLRALYRLNPTEIRLVDELVSGRRLKDAAQELRLTENTARFYLKEVFRKMSVNCQGDLLRAVLAMPGIGDAPDADPTEAVGERKPRRMRQASLRTRERRPTREPVPQPSSPEHSRRIEVHLLPRPVLRPRLPFRSPGELRLTRLLATL